MLKILMSLDVEDVLFKLQINTDCDTINFFDNYPYLSNTQNLRF